MTTTTNNQTFLARSAAHQILVARKLYRAAGWEGDIADYVPMPEILTLAEALPLDVQREGWEYMVKLVKEQPETWPGLAEVADI